MDVVEGAAERQMGFVRQYQSGEHAADAARILTELATARHCLLKPATKAAYDVKLRAQLAAAEPDPSLDFADRPLSDEGRRHSRRDHRHMRRQGSHPLAW